MHVLKSLKDVIQTEEMTIFFRYRWDRGHLTTSGHSQHC